MSDRITEKELRLPALYLMNENGGRITTTELNARLRPIMIPSGEDLSILAGRGDDKFSQKVRNLKSHSSFGDLAQYVKDGRKSYYQITDEGKEYLSQREEALEHLLGGQFTCEDVVESIPKIDPANSEHKTQPLPVDENMRVREGDKVLGETAGYVRSKALRDYAISYFAANGGLRCYCCGFDFKEFYGKLGDGLIEIHHKKPIFQYADEDRNAEMSKAVLNLVPVCSNCHRVIHRTWRQPVDVELLKAEIAVSR